MHELRCVHIAGQQARELRLGEAARAARRAPRPGAGGPRQRTQDGLCARLRICVAAQRLLLLLLRRLLRMYDSSAVSAH